MSWTEPDSQDFIDYGSFFVPYRKEQIDILIDLLSGLPQIKTCVDLCCGEGLWSLAVLRQFPEVQVCGYDKSTTMLEKAEKQLAGFNDRFITRQFDLHEYRWRKNMPVADAVISSLAIHHLNEEEKAILFQDIFKRLRPGGIFLIADIVKPSQQSGFKTASRQWLNYVKHQSDKKNQPQAFIEFKEQKWNYFQFPDDDELDQPSTLFDQLHWLQKAGFVNTDVFWMFAGHAMFAGWKL